ncbi:hypothetical protein [Flaviflagellibacter deserti]|uniref:Uncharacterized protein n=1 Tax=Flaviflagellibacter deserti TaxID=2267266 RepID=A0ABV9Z6Y7_9HYPH
MDPVSANASAAAILEGYRRAMSEQTPVVQSDPDELTLTDVLENATEHAQGLAGYRLAGPGKRLDRSA